MTEVTIVIDELAIHWAMYDLPKEFDKMIRDIKWTNPDAKRIQVYVAGRVVWQRQDFTLGSMDPFYRA